MTNIDLSAKKYIFDCIGNIFEALKRDLISLILMGKLGRSLIKTLTKACNVNFSFAFAASVFHFSFLWEFLRIFLDLFFLWKYLLISFLHLQHQSFIFTFLCRYRFYTAGAKIFLFLGATNPIFTFTQIHISFTVNFSLVQISSRFCILCYAHPIVMGLSIIRTFPF